MGNDCWGTYAVVSAKMRKSSENTFKNDKTNGTRMIKNIERDMSIPRDTYLAR